MKPQNYIEALEDLLLPQYETERTKLDVIDGWLRWTPEEIKVKRTTDRELRYLKEISQTPWPRLVIETTAQAIKAEGIYAADRRPEDLHAMWGPWDRNDMETKQGAIYRASLGYGLAYGLALPGVDSFGRPGASMTAHSPRDFFALYEDLIEDEFPTWGVRIIKQPKGAVHYRVYDDEGVTFLSREASQAKAKYIDFEAHDLGVTPIVRYANQMDLEGRAPGEIEPLVPLFSRINKTDYDRMLTQHFNSWKIRTATGVQQPATDEESASTKLKLRQDDILVAEDHEAKFGTLDETSLKPFIEAHDSDLETLAAISQTPMTTFGKLVNISADGLVEARNSLRAKVGDRKVSYGSSNVRFLRLAAHIENRAEDAENFSVRTKWADDESGALAAAVDALGKAATMLGVPPQLLWDRIPGIDSTTAQSWVAYAEEHPSADTIQAKAVANALAANIPADAAASV